MRRPGEVSKRTLFILFLICASFVLLIVKAFDFLPDTVEQKNINELSKKSAIEQEIYRPTVENQEDSAELSELDNNSDSNKSIKINYSDDISEIEPEEVSKNIQLEPIEDVAAKEPIQTKTDDYYSILKNVRQLKKDKEYSKALEELAKVPGVTTNPDEIAESYEETATIYAAMKRYGTALSYAQKAYNKQPSTSREILLARLYYKTGDVSRATQRVNNVLQRDFALDR